VHRECPCSDLPAVDQIANLQPHQVATPELAVDREVEERPISQAGAKASARDGGRARKIRQSPFPLHMRFSQSYAGLETWK